MNCLQKFKNKKWEIIALVALVGFGIFLRFYHFADWLHFELDQSFGFMIVEQALDNGISHLPLLGPAIGSGQALRLPAAYYYMEYISALVFGNTPAGHAFFVPILSVLSILIAFLFFRRFFTRMIAFLLTTLWTVSVYLVIYARFSWNPNILPFFLILSFYALLRSVSPKEKRPTVWLLIASASIAITTQLHINTFFIVPAVTFFFLLIVRPRFSWKTWLGAFVIIAFTYLPLAIHDLGTGNNVDIFKERLINDENNDNQKEWNIVPKLFRVINYTSSEYFLIVSGSDHINGSKLINYGFGSKTNFVWRVTAVIALVGLLIIFIFRLRREKDGERRNFLWIIALWFIFSTGYFYSLLLFSFNIYPRFFLASVAIPFVLLGLLFEELLRFKKVYFFIILFIFTVLVGHNAWKILTYYDSLRTATENRRQVSFNDVFPNTARVTLTQQDAIADYIYSFLQSNETPIFLKTHREVRPIIWFQLEKRGVMYNGEIDNNKYYSNAEYFVIRAVDEDSSFFFDSSVKILHKRDFGSLTVWHFRPEENLSEMVKGEKIEQRTERKQIEKLQTWHTLFTKEL